MGSVGSIFTETTATKTGYQVRILASIVSVVISYLSFRFADFASRTRPSRI